MRWKRLREDRTGALVHDAGHLLESLRTYAEMLTLPGVLSEDHRHLAQELQVLSDRSAAMLGQLMTLGAAEAAPASFGSEMEVTVLPEAVLDCLGLLSRMAGRAVTFFCSPSAYLPVAVSRAGFERILVNLVKNAADAVPGSVGTVAVTLVGMRDPVQQVTYQVLTVQGRGRAGTSVKRRDGAAGTWPAEADVRRGIGFQVVQELAASSGARVEVESDLESGTSVSVSWPAVDPRKGLRKTAQVDRLARSSRLGGLEQPVDIGGALLVGGEAC